MEEVVARTRDPERARKAEIVRENLKLFREAAGLTQQEAALLTEESIDNIRRWEARGGIKSIEISKLAKVYKRTVEQITTEQDRTKITKLKRPEVAYTAITGLSAETMKKVADYIAKVGGEFREIKLRKDSDDTTPTPAPTKKPRKGRK